MAARRRTCFAPRGPWLVVHAFGVALALGCGTSSSSTDAAVDADAAIPPIRNAPPAAPSSGDDPAFTITARHWLMAGDPLTPRDAQYEITVAAPSGTRVVDAWIDASPGARLEARADGTFHALLDAPAVGDHTVLLAADGRDTAFASRPLHVTAALYAIVSVDWDDSDPGDANLLRMERLREHHAGLVYSQFLGPYVLTDPATTADRKRALLDWVMRQRAAGDEIGVHIHPRCSFVDTTTVPCRSMPSDVYPSGDTSGYTVIVESYSADEQTTLLQSSADLFVMNGLPRPTSFRAGGWTAGAGTLEACERAGYAVESSAFPPETIQSAWGSVELGRWTLANWGGITPTSQPYHPSRTHVASSEPSPTFAVLEIPDNGTLVDYMSGAAMIQVLDANWPGRATALNAPREVQFGLHPGSFSTTYQSRLEEALTEVGHHMYADDTGPIVYARLTDLTRVWP